MPASIIFPISVAFCTIDSDILENRYLVDCVIANRIILMFCNNTKKSIELSLFQLVIEFDKNFQQSIESFGRKGVQLIIRTIYYIHSYIMTKQAITDKCHIVII